ncbi:MAG TPA: VWA domain-containing protein [Thermoanaerobaculia bacterium]|jgi:Ca-activated chloride channel family protein
MSWPAFADPLWLLLLLAAPWLAWRHRRRGSFGALAASRMPLAAGARWRLALPRVARLAAFVLAVVALARPQLGYSWEEATTEGIDIQIALDVSGSMAAKDFSPDRLEVAKRVVREFVAGRPGDRIGLTTFSGSALTRSPLTSDRRMLDELVAALEPTLTPDGTAIGVALANAAGRLKDSAAKSKVIILVTDGVNNAGEIDPLSAAAVAEGLGLEVYTVGVGSEGEARVPVQLRNPLTGRIETRDVTMRVEVDEKLLAEIARRTGGRFDRATDADALERVFAEIDRLERTPMQVKRYVRYREGFQPFAWAAFALAAAPLLLALAGVTIEP